MTIETFIHDSWLLIVGAPGIIILFALYINYQEKKQERKEAGRKSKNIFDWLKRK